ncbi:MAG: alkaline phosphatase D family protein [Dehalococcoidia bacterium]
MAKKWALCLFVVACLAALIAGCGEEEAVKLTFTHGVASGDVTTTSAVLWTRVDQEGEVTAEVAFDEQFAQVTASETVLAKADDDFVVKVAISGLGPGQRYYYRFLSSDGTASPTGTFLTAPPDTVASDVVFAYSGDSNSFYKPFRLLSTVVRDDPAFFIYLGDTIYADDDRGGIPVATTVDGYREHYKFNREDEHLQGLLAATSTYAIWDDHEVVNDFAGQTVDPDMLAAGRQAFLEYMPIRPNPDDPNRLYRSFRWGKDVELFILDERQYRSAEYFCKDEEGGTVQFPTRMGDKACQEGLSDPARTFLGKEQLEWLKQALLASEAKFKFIVNEVPISEFLLLPYDRWEGYPAEREELLSFITDNGIKNVTFLTTDLHAAIVNTLKEGPVEIVIGPIGMDPLGMELESLGVSIPLLEGLLPDITDEFYELNAFNYGLVKVLTSETPAKVLIEIKDQEGKILHTVEIVES